tara:strand:- start:206 stop:403 length:198 start_codon:yes stop_codon:yes gene_type:complete
MEDSKIKEVALNIVENAVDEVSKSIGWTLSVTVLEGDDYDAIHSAIFKKVVEIMNNRYNVKNKVI